MKRLNIFIKGNVDVHDTLHSCRIGGELAWNGINEALRASHPGCLARVKHETWSRSDALLQADGIIPETISSRQMPLGAYPAESQFSDALWKTKADVIVLSIQTDLTTGLYRHRKEGFLFYPSGPTHWNATDQAWLKSDFEPLGYLDAAASMANFAAIVERIRTSSEAPILIFNMSPVTPGETIHCYQGLEDIFSTRIRRFNLGLIGLSEATGVSIIDVDSLLARQGADRLKLDAFHLTPPAYRLIAEEVVRVLADLGVLDESTG